MCSQMLSQTCHANPPDGEAEAGPSDAAALYEQDEATVLGLLHETLTRVLHSATPGGGIIASRSPPGRN